MTSEILLGFEVGTGEEVYMQNHHSVVTGMTQLSGKTTTLEALVHRGNVKAIAFLTKRGEGGFRGQQEIPAYFKEQRKGRIIDWQYVEAILAATMGEKMKFERSWIVKTCKGANSLQEVYENIKAEQKKTRRSLDESIYTNLAAYFEIILPEISKYQFANKITLKNGFNVMNLIGVTDEMQQLIIESTLSYVLQKEKNTVVIIPEAHKFIPQGRKTPVKATALRLIREGAAIGNYLWIDTQETTSVDKAILKQCSNWIMGYQQERNEVANVRENIGKRKISEEDIMNLKIGHFVASLQQQIHHVYVLPAGIANNIGVAVAKGEIGVATVKAEIKPNDSTNSGKKYQGNLREEIDQIPISEHTILLPGGTGPLLSETEQELDRLRGIEDEYEEYKKNTEDQEQAYRDSIDALKEEKAVVMKLNEKTTTDLTNLQEKHERLLHTHETIMGALKVVLEPIVKDLVPEASVVVDEKTIERIVEQKIKAMPAKQRAKVESTGDTGIPWVDMWLPKLKTAADRKIVTLLASRIGTSLTKTQIALALGYAEKGGSFNSALSGLVRKYKLVIKEGDTYRIAEAPV